MTPDPHDKIPDNENTASRTAPFLDTLTTGIGTAANNADRTPPNLEELRRELGLTDGNWIDVFTELSTIGFGGHGAVFSAREPGLSREIALKILRPEFRNNSRYLDSFIREARITAQIGHPNIIPVHHLGVFDDVGVYFTMKRVEGETLRSLLKKLQSGDEACLREYSLSRRLEIFLDIGHGVAFAHSRGIIHRDLKPANVMVGEYGEVLVMDWGLAEYHEEKDTADPGSKLQLPQIPETAGDGEEEREQLAANQARISGTPAYMAPEQAQGQLWAIDEKSDQYGLGAILYSLLTLEAAPFDTAMDTDELLKRVVAGRFVAPRKRAPRQRIPLELEAIVLKAMSTRKSERYPTVLAMLKDVRDYLDNNPVSAYSNSLFYRFRKLCKRRPLIPMSVLIALLLAGGTMVFRLFDSYRESGNLLLQARYSMEKAEWNLYCAERAGLRNRNIDDYLRYSGEFVSYNDAALDALDSVQRLGFHRRKADSLRAEILTRELNFLIRTEDYALLDRRLRQAVTRHQINLEELATRNPRFGRPYSQMLKDSGSIDITTEPSAKLTLINTAGTPIELGTTPVAGELPAGWYQLQIHAPNRAPLTMPLSIRRGALNRFRFRVPVAAPPGTVYIPAGEYYRSGSDVVPAEKHDLPGFFLSRTEVTIGEYLRFWKQLPTDELREQYRARIIASPPLNRPLRLWDDAGRITPPFRADLPVVGISGTAAEAWCAFRGRELGKKCRLPTADEYLKAVRSGDRRDFVWGDTYRPGKALLSDHPEAAGQPTGAPPGSCPGDITGTGIADLTGNVREFVRDEKLGRHYYGIKGGSHISPPWIAAATRTDSTADAGADVGFRYVIEE